MADAIAFGAQYITAVQSLIKDLETLRLLNSRASADATLAQNYAGAPNARTDLAAKDLTDVQAAVTQILFAYDSGSPTQKSVLFRML